MRRQRILIGSAGLALGLFGVFRLVTQVPFDDLVVLAVWFVAAVAIHDGVLSPVVLAVGAVLTRVPRRARRHLQFGLVVGGLVTVVATPLIARQGTQPAVRALLTRNYLGGLGILLAIIAAASLVAYAVDVARRDGVSDASRAADGHADD